MDKNVQLYIDGKERKNNTKKGKIVMSKSILGSP